MTSCSRKILSAASIGCHDEDSTKGLSRRNRQVGTPGGSERLLCEGEATGVRATPLAAFRYPPRDACHDSGKSLSACETWHPTGVRTFTNALPQEIRGKLRARTGIQIHKQ